MNFSVTFVLMVAASLAGTAYGAPSFHDFLDDDDVEANQQLLGEFGNNEVSFFNNILSKIKAEPFFICQQIVSKSRKCPTFFSSWNSNTIFQFDDQPLGTLGDGEVVGQGLAVSRITRRSLGTLGDQNEPANPPKVSLGTLGDSEVSIYWKRQSWSMGSLLSFYCQIFCCCRDDEWIRKANVIFSFSFA